MGVALRLGNPDGRGSQRSFGNPGGREGGQKMLPSVGGVGGGAWIFSGIIQYSKPQTQNSNSPPLRWNLQIRMMLTN